MTTIFTTYLGNIKKIQKETNLKDEDIAIVYIMERVPVGVKRAFDRLWMPEAAPDARVLWKYKKREVTFNKLKDHVEFKVQNNGALDKLIEKIKVFRSAGYKYVFICCCEKDETTCHRTAVRRLLEQLKNVDIKEYTSGDIPKVIEEEQNNILINLGEKSC